MGNRAIIKGVGGTIGLYLHWNGGYDSVYAFTQYCKMKGYRSPDQDEVYGIARLAQVVGNYFGGTMSVGVVPVEKDLTPEIVEEYYLDNGIYELEDWEIVRHWNPDLIDPENEFYEKYDSTKLILILDRSMPIKEQLGEEYILASEVPVSELNVGDNVFLQVFDGNVEKCTVVGFAPMGTIRNGIDVGGLPYVDRYDHDGDFSWNINNYLQDATIKKAREE